jgi:hypothetical protein
VRALTLIVLGLAATPQVPAEYETGGPLAGLKLPPFPTQHGEPAGHPGCLRDGEGKFLYSPEGQPPELELRPGSVEHFRAYWFKYCPVRSFFDRQSFIRDFPAKDLYSRTEEYAEPLYWVPRHGAPKHTGKFRKPVPVVRCVPGAPTLNLDLGRLEAGLYALRVIAAVETEALERHRKPLYLRAWINDGPAGEESVTRLRLGYVDEFYSVAEIYFHALAPRPYRARILLDRESQASLLVNHVDLHDVLAGYTRRAVKTRSTLPDARPAPDPLPSGGESRRIRDEQLWNSFPPLNAQPGTIFGMGGDDGKSNWPRFGAEGKTPEEIEKEWGAWKDPHRDGIGPVLLENAKLGLKYTIDDLRARRPLPDPYPYKDDGAGLCFAADAPGQSAQNWQPVAEGVRDRMRACLRTLDARLAAWRTQGDLQAGRDAAVMLCRVAWQFPAMDFGNALSSVIVQPGAYGRDLRCRRREMRLDWIDVDYAARYDQLFDLIRADGDLAASIGRFVPWVRSSKDLIQLFDVYLVQTLARRYLRYHYYWSNEPARIVVPATVLADPAVTGPWMDWLFSRTFVYPLPPAGFQDLLVTGNDRDGIGHIGSFYYGQVEEAATKGETLERYLLAGGDPKYDLRDPARYPKVTAACAWFLDTRTAGLWTPRIGDVSGPDKSYGVWFEYLESMSRRGWRWTGDPRFAAVLKHYGGRKGESDAEWAAVEKAAQGRRVPWLENRSRVVSNWFGVLESGTEHDDFRFRRSAMVRVGQGFGHQHADTLDLQITAHGYPATIDGGQRGGYSAPADSATRVHNVVEVDGKDWIGHSWVTALTDAPGARYLACEAEPPRSHASVKMHRRQTALVDVDEGTGSRPLDPSRLRPNVLLPPGVTTPKSYVFDVVRVSGGKTHTYCFHGPVDDELATNMTGRLGWEGLAEDDRKYLEKFRHPARTSGGKAPEVLEATWRLTRDDVHGSEKRVSPPAWDESSPRKGTRLHLFGVGGAPVLASWAECMFLKYGFSCLFVRRKSAIESDAVFAALVEPFAGEPFIAGRKSLDIPGNEEDGRRAVAVEVLTKDGRRDLCFADGRPGKTRRAGEAAVSGEFAFVSADGKGLRQASLTGGTLLETPRIVLKPASRERSGRVTGVNYPGKSMDLDTPWPPGYLKGRSFEVGTGRHWTTFTIEDAIGPSLKVRGGADYYLSRVIDVDPAKGEVTCGIGFAPLGGAPCPGLDRDWAATNESLTKSWRAEYLGGSRDEGRYTFRLTGGPVGREDFGEGGGFRLWEYGPGDTVRQATWVTVRRIEDGLYEAEGDVETEIGFKAARVEISADRKEWRSSTRVAEKVIPGAKTWFRVRPD